MRFRPAITFALLCLTFASPSFAAPTVLRHDLQVQLLPAEQALAGSDRLTVRTDGAGRLTLVLAPDAVIEAVSAAGREVRWSFRGGELVMELPSGLRGDVPVEIRYRAIFADPAPARPLSTEDPSYGVAATIGPEGAFLNGGAGWYPEIAGSRPTFRLEILTPPELSAVGAGRLVESAPGRTVWETDRPLPGAAMAAGPYVRREARAGEVPVYAFFYPQSADLADDYLQAAQGYLRLYQELFGPYPFEKFAVAENFFPTGYGYPSWTLLGSSVVRLPFIVSTSLGHEIAHSWWGNGVWVDRTRGNWSEGLTTYVADYLYQERRTPADAREYRLKILRDYASLVPPAKDFPLSRFTSRSSPAEQAVGYGKAAMVFHMARRQVGEEAFWGGLRHVAGEKLFRPAAWEDFAAAFGKTEGGTMTDFFRQWVDRPGAPVLTLAGIRRERTDNGWEVSGVLRQQAPFYQLEVPLRLETAAGTDATTVLIRGSEAAFRFRTAAEPRRLHADPDTDVFRRLDPAEIPPMVNGLRASESLLAVAAAGISPATLEAGRALLAAMGQPKLQIVPEAAVKAADLLGHDLLLLGLPSRRDLLPPLPPELAVTTGGFILQGKNYTGKGAALFAALPHPSDRARVAGLFLPGSAAAADSAARKIPHYGKYSFLAFVDGGNVAKGTWPPAASPLVHDFARETSGGRP